MRKGIAVLALAAWAGSLSGCSREPDVVPVDGLAFPVVFVTGRSPSGTFAHSADIRTGKDDLGHLRVELYSNLSGDDPPIVIGSDAAIFEMRDIKGEHGGLWMMANPTGQMPIQYRLVRYWQSGIAAARDIVADCTYLGRDLDQDRRKLRSARIRRAATMAEAMQIVDEPAPMEASLPE